jgi:dTDP-4-dehydrorhamnose 3,5-epimerase
MKIEQTIIEGIVVIHSEPFKDERGFFNRIFCQKELEAIQPNIVIAQISYSMTKTKGTIRGMHFQYPPYCEMKIVRCVKGVIFDVAVDLRRNSPTFLQWHGEILSAENMKALVIPEGCAHGFQSLEDNIEMIYISTSLYCKEAENGIRFDDSKVDIQWPMNRTVISERDISYSFLSDNYEGILV